MKNYPYPKNEDEFFSRQYSVDDLKKNYPFDELVAYYIYGMNLVKKINHIIENNLYFELGVDQGQVEFDFNYFVVRTIVVKRAIEVKGQCEVLNTSNQMFIVQSN